MPDPTREREFVSLAISRGFVTEEQHQEALRVQEGLLEEGVSVPVWEVFSQLGYMTEDQANRLQAGESKARGFAFGPYVIESKLGEGGMGIVYRAKKQGEDRVVALKVMPSRAMQDKESEKRFEREARIAVVLHHPNIVRGFEYGQIKGRWYYAMELVEGKVVGELLDRREAMTERAALQIVAQIAQALVVIHKQALVHRDIKPDNIIVGQDGVAKLMDLGLAKMTGRDLSRLTQSGFSVGTPRYMSPEQILGKEEVDGRSDIYSLGSTLYHMVTGVAPFHGNLIPQILKNQLHHRLEDPRRHRADLSDGVVHILERMMARHREDRYLSAGALLQDLDEVLNGRPPSSKRIEVAKSPIARRVVKDPVKPLYVAAAVGIVALFIVVGLALSGGPEPVVEAPPPPGPTRAETLMADAKHLFEMGRLDQAEEAINEAGRLQPGIPDPLDLQGLIKKERTRKAEEEAAARKKKRDAEEFRKRLDVARAHLKQKEWARALQACRDALKAKPNDPEAKTFMDGIAKAHFDDAIETARRLGDEGRIGSALAKIAEALAVRPGDESAIALRERLAAQVGEAEFRQSLRRAEAAYIERKWTEAETEVAKALALRPQDAEALSLDSEISQMHYQDAYDRASRHAGAKEWAEAYQAVEEALGLRAGDDLSLKLRDRIVERGYESAMRQVKEAKERGDLAAAAEAARVAAALRPEAQPLFEEVAYDEAIKRAAAHVERQEWAEARTAYEQALAVRPTDDAAEAGLKSVESKVPVNWLRKRRSSAYRGERFNEWGGDQATEQALLNALEWLSRHQSSDGSWRAVNHIGRCGRSRPGACDPGPGATGFDVAVTGLAVLAFLGAGHIPDDESEYGTVTRRGLEYLRRVQSKEGLVGPEDVPKYMYNHLIGTLALIEAYGMTGSGRAEAERTLEFTLRARNPGRTWRYSFQSGDNDSSVTAWGVQVLKAAGHAGLKVPDAAWKGVIAWYDEVTEPTWQRVGYKDRKIGKVVLTGINERYDDHVSLTGPAILARVERGERDDPRVAAGAAMFKADLPAWKPDRTSVDVYYWYYGTIAVYQVDGPDGEGWRKWLAALKRVVLGTQNANRRECRFGSWEPVDRWSSEGGRVYMTALTALTLETAYRYPW